VIRHAFLHRPENPNMKNTIGSIALAAAALAAAVPAQAVTMTGFTAGPGTVVTDFSAPGQLAFDLDLASFAPVSISFRIDDGDLGMPIAFDAMVRNLSLSGLGELSFTLSKGSFGVVGSVTRFFGGTTQTSVNGGAAMLTFTPEEFFDVEIGNALGTTPAALDWSIPSNVFTAGETLTVSVMAAVPEPGTWALMAGGLGLVAFLARRRRV
jgi:hypothetical protein